MAADRVHVQVGGPGRRQRSWHRPWRHPAAVAAIGRTRSGIKPVGPQQPSGRYGVHGLLHGRQSG